MNTMEERYLIYPALLLLCAVSAAFVGAVAALWSLVQIVAVIELVFLVGVPARVRRFRDQ